MCKNFTKNQKSLKLNRNVLNYVSFRVNSSPKKINNFRANWGPDVMGPDFSFFDITPKKTNLKFLNFQHQIRTITLICKINVNNT